MTARITLEDLTVARAHAAGPAAHVVASLTSALRASLAGRPAAAVVFFASAAYDPAELAGPLAERFAEAQVLGCSTAGEFTDTVTGTGGVSVLAFPKGLLVRAVAGLGDLEADAASGADAAIAEVEAGLGVPLRSLDPTRHVGLVLIDGMHGAEEAVNERLGNAAPILDVVGGSAGDDLEFRRTWVSVGPRVSWNGVALLVIEPAVAFQVVKTCSFVTSGRTLRITKADVPSRTVLEFDGRPAVEAYADALGVAPQDIDGAVFMRHPVGLMIDGEPWIRSPQRLVDEGGLAFYAQILEGMDVEVMTATDLVAETTAAVAKARAELGGSSGAIMFNCILRRLELDAKGLSESFLGAFDGVPTAGFHTYGESWLGHVNQTLTGVVLGRPAVG